MRHEQQLFPLDQDTRISVWQDDEFIDYLHDWEHEYFGVFTLGVSRDLRPLELNAELHKDNLNAIRGWLRANEWHTAIDKHFRRQNYLARIIELQGYSQWEWADVVIWTTLQQDQQAALDSFYDELTAWFRDGFHNVALEKRVVYTAPDGRTLEQWEVEHAIGGVLFTNKWQLTKENALEVLA